MIFCGRAQCFCWPESRFFSAAAIRMARVIFTEHHGLFNHKTLLLITLVVTTLSRCLNMLSGRSITLSLFAAINALCRRVG